MPAVTIRWVSMHDDAVCPICRELNALAHWTFEGHEGVPQQLEWGGIVVWDTMHGSDAHGHHRGTPKCRCHLNMEWDLSDLVANAQRLLEVVQAATGGPEV